VVDGAVHVVDGVRKEGSFLCPMISQYSVFIVFKKISFQMSLVGGRECVFISGVLEALSRVI
jgi:hypothetical protein